MRTLAILQALGRPVLLAGPPASFADAGLLLRGSVRVDGLELHAVALPVGARLRSAASPALDGSMILLPSGVRLAAIHLEEELWSLAVVDDAREAERVGARVLAAMGLQVDGEEQKR